VVAWSLFGLALYEIGQLRKLTDLRRQGYALALLSFFFTAGMLAGNHARVLTGCMVIACFYCAQLLAPRNEGENFERYARAFYSLLAMLLLAKLTMVWAAEALALLGAGFPLRDRVQRLSGLTLFMVCVLKLFLYDLRQPHPFFRFWWACLGCTPVSAIASSVICDAPRQAFTRV
jgi:hypothetical protein